jgi:hypothetical protein
MRLIFENTGTKAYISRGLTLFERGSYNRYEIIRVV